MLGWRQIRHPGGRRWARTANCGGCSWPQLRAGDRARSLFRVPRVFAYTEVSSRVRKTRGFNIQDPSHRRPRRLRVDLPRRPRRWWVVTPPHFLLVSLEGLDVAQLEEQEMPKLYNSSAERRELGGTEGKAGGAVQARLQAEFPPS